MLNNTLNTGSENTQNAVFIPRPSIITGQEHRNKKDFYNNQYSNIIV